MMEKQMHFVRISKKFVAIVGYFRAHHGYSLCKIDFLIWPWNPIDVSCNLFADANREQWTMNEYAGNLIKCQMPSDMLKSWKLQEYVNSKQ